MGEALYDLEQLLRSRKEKITSEEANILMKCKAQGVRDFFIGSLGASVVTWFACQRFKNIYRINLTAGAAASIGLWRFGRSLDSCIDHILSLEGTRIKNELAKIVLTKYQNDPSIMQRISQHFYSENVFDDTTKEKPKLRWRIRNHFTDYHEPAESEKMKKHDNNNESHTYGDNKSQSSDADNIHLQRQQFYVNAKIEAKMDPFDCVFGVSSTMSENSEHQSDESSLSSRRHARKQRRSHRRHYKRHHEMSANN